MKASLSCSVFLFRQLCTRGKPPAKRPRNAPLWGLNLSAQLSLVNLFLCEIFPKPFIPPLSSGSWNAEKNTFFLFSRMCLLCAGRGWAKVKRKQSNVHRHTHTNTHPAVNNPTEAQGLLWAGEGWQGAPGTRAVNTCAVWTAGPQPGTKPEKHLTGCFHGNITVSLEWKAAVVGQSQERLSGCTCACLARVCGEEQGAGNCDLIFP